MQDEDSLEFFRGYVERLDGGVVKAIFNDSDGDSHEAAFPLTVMPEAERDRVRIGTHIEMMLSPTDIDIRLAEVVLPKKGGSDAEMLARYIRSMR